MAYEYTKPNKKLNGIIMFSRKFHFDKLLYYIYDHWYKRFFPDNYMKQSNKYFSENKDSIDYIIKQLSDDKSKKVFKAVIDYRIMRKPLCGDNVEPSSEQYFSGDIIKLENESFVDCGAFNGDTLFSFIDHLKDGKTFQNYYAFEADPKLSEILIQNISKLDNVERIQVYNVGISNKKQVLSFKSDYGECGTFDEKGDINVNADTLDNILGKTNKITFIKMDIEGAEKSAIQGAFHIIQEQRPKLAISIYHSMYDMIELPILLMKNLNNYNYYIRHYTNFVQETILYAIPYKSN